MLYDRCSSLTLRHLQIFAAVSRQRSFARAAEGLCLSQPAVSAQIKELETILGVRLLVRSRGCRQIDLTPAGEVLLASCAEIAELLGSHAALPGIAAGQLAILQVEGFLIRIDYAVIHQKGNLSPAAGLYRRHLLTYRSA